MAIFYLNTKPFSRKGGRSIVKHVANLFEERLFDVQSDKFFNGSVKDKSHVLGNALHLPRYIFFKKYFSNKKIVLSDFLDRQTLWNLAEASETRSNSRTAREIIVNVPCELSLPKQIQLMHRFAGYLANTYDVIVDCVLRSPSDNNDARCYRAHFLLTTRIVELNEHNDIVLGGKSILEWSNTQLKNADLLTCQAELKSIRNAWAIYTNTFLERAGSHQHIDSRSYVEQGLKISPTLPLGSIEFALKKQIQSKRGDYNRQIIHNNQIIIETKTLYERQVQQRIEHTNTFIDTACSTAEATDRLLIKRAKFARRTDKTNQFIEAYHHHTAETDKRIAELNRAKSQT